jgi:hypothetical protein
MSKVRQSRVREIALPIGGSATLDTTGIYVTRAGAERYAKKHMPSDLKAAGFEASVCGGQEVHDGSYRACWRINYGSGGSPHARSSTIPAVSRRCAQA